MALRALYEVIMRSARRRACGSHVGNLEHRPLVSLHNHKIEYDNNPADGESDERGIHLSTHPFTI
jgi:hypothetical protein